VTLHFRQEQSLERMCESRRKQQRILNCSHLERDPVRLAHGHEFGRWLPTRSTLYRVPKVHLSRSLHAAYAAPQPREAYPPLRPPRVRHNSKQAFITKVYGRATTTTQASRKSHAQWLALASPGILYSYSCVMARKAAPLEDDTPHFSRCDKKLAAPLSRLTRENHFVLHPPSQRSQSRLHGSLHPHLQLRSRFSSPTHSKSESSTSPSQSPPPQ
jgi:hypothetical protein